MGVANINGKLVEYDVCSSYEGAFKSWPLVYIGSGYVYSEFRVKQMYPRKGMHFWVKK